MREPYDSTYDATVNSSILSDIIDYIYGKEEQNHEKQLHIFIEKNNMLNKHVASGFVYKKTYFTKQPVHDRAFYSLPDLSFVLHDSFEKYLDRTNKLKDEKHVVRNYIKEIINNFQYTPGIEMILPEVLHVFIPKYSYHCDVNEEDKSWYLEKINIQIEKFNKLHEGTRDLLLKRLTLGLTRGW